MAGQGNGEAHKAGKAAHHVPPVLLLDRDGSPLCGGGLRRNDARQLRLVQLTNAVDLADGLLSREVRCQVLQQVAEFRVQSLY